MKNTDQVEVSKNRGRTDKYKAAFDQGAQQALIGKGVSASQHQTTKRAAPRRG